MVDEGQERVCAVCGQAVVTTAPGLAYQGARWFFCGMPCRLAFKREPERWAEVGAAAAVRVQRPARTGPPKFEAQRRYIVKRKPPEEGRAPRGEHESHED